MDAIGLQTSRERMGEKSVIFFLYAYVLLLPIGTGLSGIIGSISFMNYLAMGIILMGLFTCIRKRVITLDKQVMPTMFFFIYTVLSVAWSEQIIMNWYVLTNMVNFTLFMVIISCKLTDKEIDGIEHYVGFSQLIVFWAVMKNISSLFRYRLNITIVSTIGISDFACGLCLIMAMWMNTATTTKKKSWKVIAYLCLILDFAIILMSGSRGAMVMAFAMIFIWFMRGEYSGKSKAITILVVILSAILFYKFFLPFLPGTVRNRLTLDAVIKTNGSGRFKVWLLSLEIFQDSSIFRQLFGNGFNSFMHVINYGSHGGHQDLMAHNVVIQMLLEGGIVGIVLLFAMILSQFRMAIKNHDNMMLIALAGLFIAALSIDMQVTRIWGFILTLNCIRQSERNAEKQGREAGNGNTI